MVPTTPTLPSTRASRRRDLALARPRQVGRWVAGLAAAAAAVITGVVAHQLPGAASPSASGSASSTGSSGTTGSTGSSSSATSSGGAGAGSAGTSAGQPQTVTPSYSPPVVVSGGSTVR